jgi:hypothetical protein
MIDPLGLKNSKRNKKDGYTFFGTDNFNENNENWRISKKKIKIINDYCINYDICNDDYENLFFIQFFKCKNKYLNKDKQIYHIRQVNQEHNDFKYCLYARCLKPYVIFYEIK